MDRDSARTHSRPSRRGAEVTAASVVEWFSRIALVVIGWSMLYRGRRDELLSEDAALFAAWLCVVVCLTCGDGPVVSVVTK